MVNIISEKLYEFNELVCTEYNIEDGLLLTLIDAIFLIALIPSYCMALIIGLILGLSELLKGR